MTALHVTALTEEGEAWLRGRGGRVSTMSSQARLEKDFKENSKSPKLMFLSSPFLLLYQGTALKVRKSWLLLRVEEWGEVSPRSSGTVRTGSLIMTPAWPGQFTWIEARKKCQEKKCQHNFRKIRRTPFL